MASGTRGHLMQPTVRGTERRQPASREEAAAVTSPGEMDGCQRRPHDVVLGTMHVQGCKQTILMPLRGFWVRLRVWTCQAKRQA